MKDQNAERTLTDQYGDFVEKLAPFGWEIVAVASANLLGIFMISFGHTYTEIRWGLLFFILIEVLFAGIIYWKKTK